MSTVLEQKREQTGVERQFATFYLGNMLLGVDIRQVREINRQLEVTQVPQVPKAVHGVINLRGEVVTVLNLSTVLGLPPAEVTRESRALIVQYQGESIGLLVDRISDILTLCEDDLGTIPAHMNSSEGRFFVGVHALDTEVLVILNLDEVMAQS